MAAVDNWLRDLERRPQKTMKAESQMFLLNIKYVCLDGQKLPKLLQLIAKLTKNCIKLTSSGWSCFEVTAILDLCLQIMDLSATEVTATAVMEIVMQLCPAASWPSLRRQTRSFITKLFKLWSSSSVCFKASVNVVSGSEEAYSLCLTSLFFKYAAETNQLEALESIRKSAIEKYTKSVISARTSVPDNIVHSSHLLRSVNKDDFKSIMFPAIQKAILRNPELILSSVATVVKLVWIDLSPFALELVQLLCPLLRSKEENTRSAALLIIENLARQCSDSQALLTSANYLFDLYRGKIDGKLTTLEEKFAVLAAIGALADNQVTGSLSLTSLSDEIFLNYSSLLKQEAHEGTLTQALAGLELWAARLKAEEIPKSFQNLAQNGLSQKSGVGSVRLGYLKCLLVALEAGAFLSASDLSITSYFAVSLERMNLMPNQVNPSSEAVVIANILLRLSTTHNPQAALDPFVNWFLDSSKNFCLSSKFILSSSVGPIVLCSLAAVLENLVSRFQHEFTETSRTLYLEAIVKLLCHPVYKVRSTMRTKLRSLLAGLDGSRFSLDLIRILYDLITRHEDIGIAVATATAAVKEEEGSLSSVEKSLLQPHLVWYALVSITPHKDTVSWQKYEVTKFAVEMLRVAHHPLILEKDKNCWSKLVRHRLGFPDLGALVDLNLSHIITKLMPSPSIDLSQLEAISTLCRVCPTFFKQVLEACLTNLSFIKSLHVSQEEFNILKHPEGQLYNKSILENCGESSMTKQKNIPRASKGYKYKEQMEEIELMKQLEAERRAKAKEAPIKLTLKEQQRVTEEIAKESDLRAKLKKVEEDASAWFAVLTHCFYGNNSEFGRWISTVYEFITANKVATCLITAPLVNKLVVQIGNTWFKASLSLGGLISQCLLRSIFECNCKLECDWPKLSSRDLSTQSIDQLHEYVFGMSTGSGDPGHGSPSQIGREGILQSRLSCAQFGFCLPILNSYLLSNYHLVHSSSSANLSSRAVARTAPPGADRHVIYSLQLIRSHIIRPFDLTIRKHSENIASFPHEQLIHLAMELLGSNSSDDIVNEWFLALAESLADIGRQLSSSEIRELLGGLEEASNVDRHIIILKSLLIMHKIIPKENSYLQRRLYTAKFDKVKAVHAFAKRLWKVLKLDTFISTGEMLQELVSDLADKEEIQSSVGDAIYDLVAASPDTISVVVQQMLSDYSERLKPLPPQLDEFGRVISEVTADVWMSRCGIALGIAKLVPCYQKGEIVTLLEFMIPDALNDKNENVRKAMLDGAVLIVQHHGKDHLHLMLNKFESFLSTAPDTASFDIIRQSVVILLGRLAQHLDSNDSKVEPIIFQLIAVLKSNSQQVQESVAHCLYPLIPSIKAKAPSLLQEQLDLLLTSTNYGEKKGAAFGMAAIQKGLGTTTLEALMKTLEKTMDEHTEPRYREGAIIGFEVLCLILRAGIQPYLRGILPIILFRFADGNEAVRQASEEAAKVMMSILDAYGVKTLLPGLLISAGKTEWRTKKGAVELLGAMAHMSPDHLSSSLPKIVPVLVEVLTDSHVRVQKSGIIALNHIGSVVKNPEIQALVPELISALQEPSKQTTNALRKLLSTKFVHVVDAPSLALVMPVLQRAFQDRSMETRKMTAQIVGNMYNLTNPKDLLPYLPSILPGLKVCLLDPVPEVRSVAAKAMGSMVQGGGKEEFMKMLIPWLQEKLKSESSSVDRSGAAQGLAEVTRGLGPQQFDAIITDIIRRCESSAIDSHERDGLIMMFIYFPTVFEKEFIPYIGPCLPSILKALADEAEFVRESGLKAGQRIVNLYADKAVEIFLPELEKGLFDDNWRIRYSSVHLLGDLLYKISGVTGKMSTETGNDDETFGSDSSQQAILSVLGEERRNRVTAGLYIARADVSLLVRQAAVHVWKIVVANTPRMLKEILPVLISLLLTCLASTSYEKRQIAASTLGDVVRKMGERVLPEIIPILEKGLQSEQDDERQGVCIGLSEILASTGKDQVVMYSNILVPTVRRALTDPLPEVREAAAKTFDNLHSSIGTRALDDVIPSLLQQVDCVDTRPFALDALIQVMSIKPKVVLPYLIPQLTKPPINTHTIAMLASVAGGEGDALSKHINRLLPAMLQALADNLDEESEELELEYCCDFVLSPKDQLSMRLILDEIFAALSIKNSNRRLNRAASLVLTTYCARTTVPYDDYLPQIYRYLFALLIFEDKALLTSVWGCLHAVVTRIPMTERVLQMPHVKVALQLAGSDLPSPDTPLPGLCLPGKIMEPLVLLIKATPPQARAEPATAQAAPSSSSAERDVVAGLICEFVKRSCKEALVDKVAAITGVLIRTLSDRFSPDVKIVVLDALGALADKVEMSIKSFLPQLQTSFVKALSDSNKLVRLKAASCLGKIVPYQVKIDQLFGDILKTCENAADTPVRDVSLQSLRFSIRNGGGVRISAPTRKRLLTLIETSFDCEDASTRSTAAACLGSFYQFMDADEQTDCQLNTLTNTSASKVHWTRLHCNSISLAISLLYNAQDIVADQTLFLRFLKAAITFSSSDKMPVTTGGVQSLTYLLRASLISNLSATTGAVEVEEVPIDLLTAFTKVLKHDSNDIKLYAAQCTAFVLKEVLSSPLPPSLSKAKDGGGAEEFRRVERDLPPGVTKALVSALLNGTMEKNTAVRSQSEQALAILLRLNSQPPDPTATERVLCKLDKGLRETISELISKTLKKVKFDQVKRLEQNIDQTILK